MNRILRARGRASRALLFGVLLSWAGCNRGPARVYAPTFNASEAASRAMQQFDANGDGALAKPEAESCRGIFDEWNLYDRNADGTVTLDELTQRFVDWQGSDTGMMNMRCEVTLNGRPLTGAVVTLTPYESLGKNFYAASGKTDRYGFAFLKLQGDDLPESMQGIYGMQVGLYRVEITHPEMDLPAKYNSDSELSVDLSPVDSNTGISFALQH